MYSSCERELEFEPVPLQCEALNVSEQQVWRLRKLIMLTVVSVGGQGIMCRGESGVYIGSTWCAAWKILSRTFLALQWWKKAVGLWWAQTSAIPLNTMCHSSPLSVSVWKNRHLLEKWCCRSLHHVQSWGCCGSGCSVCCCVAEPVLLGGRAPAKLSRVCLLLGPAAVLVAMVPAARRSCLQSPPTQLM